MSVVIFDKGPSTLLMQSDTSCTVGEVRLVFWVKKAEAMTLPKSLPVNRLSM